jgi:hypothetical protein
LTHYRAEHVKIMTLSAVRVDSTRSVRTSRRQGVAIAALVLWMCTAAVGGYLLASSTRTGVGDPAPGEKAPAPEPVPEPAAVPAAPVRAKDRFDPPSLARAKSEPLPGMRALAEFAHPALAIIGLGTWLAYVLSRDRLFAAIGLGILLGAICAGLTWALANARAAKRPPGTGPDAAARHPAALTFPPRLLILHGLGAALTLLLTALIAARV